MSHLYPGIIAKVFSGGPTYPTGGMRAARYWRIDNIVRQSTNTQIRGLKFWKTGQMIAQNALDPVSITTDAGDETLVFDRSFYLSDPVNAPVVDTITFYNFDFGIPVTPDRFEVWGNEWDQDYYVSFDISYSDDNAVWTKVGEWNSETQVGRTGSLGDDGMPFVSTGIWSAENLQISSPKIAVVEGRVSNGLLINRPNMNVIHGRAGQGVLLNRPVITVIEIPT